jgi:hypothetical protein
MVQALYHHVILLQVPLICTYSTEIRNSDINLSFHLAVSTDMAQQTWWVAGNGVARYAANVR